MRAAEGPATSASTVKSAAVGASSAFLTPTGTTQFDAHEAENLAGDLSCIAGMPAMQLGEQRRRHSPDASVRRYLVGCSRQERAMAVDGWTRQFAERLHEQWPTIDIGQLEALAVTLRNEGPWCDLPPREAALEWMVQGIPVVRRKGKAPQLVHDALQREASQGTGSDIAS